MKTGDVDLNFNPRVERRRASPEGNSWALQCSLHPRAFGGEPIHVSVAVRMPKRRARVHRDVLLYVFVESFGDRLIRLTDIAEPFDVNYNRGYTATFRFHPEDLAPLMVAIDDAMQSVR